MLVSKTAAFEIWVVFFISSAYNNVIITHRNFNKSVKEHIYGTTDIIKAAELEEFTLSQTVDLKGCAAGG